MRKNAIRAFPHEAPHGPWPSLAPTPEDLIYQPKPESPEEARRRLQLESRDLLYLDLRIALLKGAILGLFAFSLIGGIVLNLPFWLQGWHWAFGIGGAIALSILIGPNATLLLLAIGTLAITIFTSIAHPLQWLMLPLFVGSGMIIKGISELFP